MNPTYLELFIQLTRAAEMLAEQMAEYNLKQDNKEEYNTAISMRDDYRKLRERIGRKNFNPATITRTEYAKLLICAHVASSNLEYKLLEIKKSLNGYKTDLIPKLNRILDETNSDVEARRLAGELFAINT